LIEFPNLATSPYGDGYIIGQPINLVKLYPFAGVDPATGLYVVSDFHGNPTTTPNRQTDRTVLLSNFSKFYGGFQNSFQFKGLQLDFLIQFVKQVAITPEFGFRNSPGRFTSGSSSGNQPVSVLDRWQKPGDISTIQKFTATSSSVINRAYPNLSGSNAYYQDASYARLKNLSLSWQLPSTWVKKMHLQNCRIYTQGQNLLTLTKYKGLDPENTTYSSLPPLRVITVGLQIKL
jgi:hypothetical protein